MPTFAFFDLDRTVFKINSGYAWLRYERGAGRISTRTFLRGLISLTRYTLGKADLEAVIRDAIKDYEGLPEADLIHRTHGFYESQVVHTIRAKARTVIEGHKLNGHQCLTLTTSTNYLADLVVRDLGLDGGLCTRLGVRDGLLTGQPNGAICYGMGKLELMSDHLLRHGGHLTDTYFYTDSFSDLPALQAVGNPIAVCPDIRLGRFARRCGWSVENW
jgi:HAD superfamily hydrolase (TIGR01490 family)